MGIRKSIWITSIFCLSISFNVFADRVDDAYAFCARQGGTMQEANRIVKEESRELCVDLKCVVGSAGSQSIDPMDSSTLDNQPTARGFVVGAWMRDVCEPLPDIAGEANRRLESERERTQALSPCPRAALRLTKPRPKVPFRCRAI